MRRGRKGRRRKACSRYKRKQVDVPPAFLLCAFQPQAPRYLPRRMSRGSEGGGGNHFPQPGFGAAPRRPPSPLVPCVKSFHPPLAFFASICSLYATQAWRLCKKTGRKRPRNPAAEFLDPVRFFFVFLEKTVYFLVLPCYNVPTNRAARPSACRPDHPAIF